MSIAFWCVSVGGMLVIFYLTYIAGRTYERWKIGERYVDIPLEKYIDPMSSDDAVLFIEFRKKTHEAIWGDE